MIDWWRAQTVLEKRSKVLLWAGLLAIVVLADHYSALYYRMGVDDSYISMQYARNLYEGNGIVFNLGERVEGYTNFLWVVVMAPLYGICQALGLDFVAWVGRTNILIAAFEVWLLAAIGRRIWGESHAGVVALLTVIAVCFVDNTFTVWPGLGLEGHFLGMWMLLALWALGSDSPRRALLTGLALTGAHLTRPDAGLFNAIVIGSLGLFQLVPFLRSGYARDEGGDGWKRFSWREIGIALGVWVGIFGVYFIWRYSYYGWLLPNTFYLKVGGEKLDAWARGYAYIKSFFVERYWVPLFALLALVVNRRVELVAVTLYLVAHLAYLTYVGGDFFPGHRFLISQIPMFALGLGVVAYGVATLVQRMQRGRAALATLATLLCAVALVLMWQRGRERGPLPNEVLRWRDERQTNRQLMAWLRDHTHERTLATGDIGACGFLADKHVIDIFGVIDPDVAHKEVPNFGHGQAGHEKRATRAEILQKSPDLIKPGYLPGDFWEEGYWLDVSMPNAIDVEGVWRKDPLRECARRLPQGRFEFLPSDVDRLTLSGDALATFPMRGAVGTQNYVHGQRGTFVNTYHPTLGDQATGTVTSHRFGLVGDLITVRVGGGRDAERLRVSLIVDGKRVHSATGRNAEVLGEHRWDIRALRGKNATLEIVDRATGAWGHILVDEITQLDLGRCEN